MKIIISSFCFVILLFVGCSDTKSIIDKKEATDQETDQQELITLFSEIKTEAESISCINANEWSFTAYGSKACGGPQGYIAYPKSNETLFLEKVTIYTNLEKAYNKKWNIFSTCDIAAKPTGVECKNGKPNLIY